LRNQGVDDGELGQSDGLSNYKILLLKIKLVFN